MILFGASMHSEVILDLLFLNNLSVEKIVDDHPVNTELYGVPIVKNDRNLKGEKAIISIGNNGVRKIIAEKYQLEYISAFHPKSVISRFSSIGKGSVAMANCVVNAGAKVGDHCILNSGSIIEHDCEIEDYVHISPNATLAGNVKIGEGTHVGIGACIIPGITIGKWCIIGAGTVITKNIPDFSVVVGNPGRIIKNMEDGEIYF